MRHNCISCGTKLSQDLVEVGNQYPSAIFIKANSPVPNNFRKESLNLAICENPDCRLIQLSKLYDLSHVFLHYPYESAITAGMISILQNLVDDSQNFVDLNEKDVILDIGGNDGTMLKLVKEKVLAKVNIDAASNINQVLDESNYYYVNGKFTEERYKSLGLPKPKLITSTAMFYHLHDPESFTKDVANIMSEDSIWILQMTYAGTMLTNNIIDNIVHEHVGYYTLKSLEYLLNRNNLYIIEAKLTESYGGSLRVFISKNEKHKGSAHSNKNYLKIKEFEEKNQINSPYALLTFNQKLQLIKAILTDLVFSIPDIFESGPLWGFGASTKGNMLLQLIGANSQQIECILDNSDKKIGTTTTGSLIPIVSENENIEKLPKNIIILPYYYTDIFIKIIKNALPPGQYCNLLIPLPYPKFITVKGK